MKRPLLLFSAVFCFFQLNSTAQVSGKAGWAKSIHLLLMFFKIQGDDGNILKINRKSSLIQAVKKYQNLTGNLVSFFLCNNAKTILHKMKDSFSDHLKNRWSALAASKTISIYKPVRIQ